MPISDSTVGAIAFAAATLAKDLVRAEHQPETVLETTTADGIWIKTVKVPIVGTVVPQHSHAWDHTTLICTGAAVVRAGDDAPWEEFRAPATVFIKAGVKHTFVILEPDTIIACIHNLHGEEAVKILEEHDLLGEV